MLCLVCVIYSYIPQQGHSKCLSVARIYANTGEEGGLCRSEVVQELKDEGCIDEVIVTGSLS